MNNINFTGINNIIPKKNFRITGALCSPNRSTINNVTLTMKLNNIDGNDLQEFYDVLGKNTMHSKKQCLDKVQPNKLELFCSNISSNNEKSSFTSASTFDVNGHTIIFDEDGVLPLFTYLSKLTGKISQKEELSTENRNAAKFINNKIQEEAEKYFDITV